MATVTGDGGDNQLNGTNDPAVGDSITGDAGNDTVFAGQGDDTVDGGADNDSIQGGEGNDSLSGGAGAGADTILGGAGNDTIEGLGGDDVIDGWNGDGESIPGGASDDDLIFGGDGNDTVTGNVGDDTIDGGSGADSLRGDGGADRIEGGTGDDQIDFTDTDAATDTFVVSDGDGSDTITGFTGPVSDGSGGFTSEDQFDVSGLSDGSGNPIDAFDVIVTDDGNGNAVLTFPDGTSTTLIGVTVAQVDTASELAAMGIPCFAAGTLIDTDQGPRKIEALEAGDLVLTRDNGFQPIRWAGLRTVTATGDLAPIRIRAGVLDNTRDLLVSPQHRVLISGWMAELYFGEDEVLVAAKALVNDHSILQVKLPAITYCHLLFDTHEVILSEGAWTESFHPGKVGLGAVADEARDEILDIFPELRDEDLSQFPVARPSINVREAMPLAALF